MVQGCNLLQKDLVYIPRTSREDGPHDTLIHADSTGARTTMPEPRAELLKGTLDLLILKALTVRPQHGYGVARWLEASSLELLRIEEGSLYPALYRMEQRGWIRSEWGQSETNRKAKFYSLTARGRGRLLEEASGWDRLVDAVTLILRTQPAEAGRG